MVENFLNSFLRLFKILKTSGEPYLAAITQFLLHYAQMQVDLSVRQATDDVEPDDGIRLGDHYVSINSGQVNSVTAALNGLLILTRECLELSLPVPHEQLVPLFINRLQFVYGAGQSNTRKKYQEKCLILFYFYS
jgi:hypothetical protein